MAGCGQDEQPKHGYVVSYGGGVHAAALRWNRMPSKGMGGTTEQAGLQPVHPGILGPGNTSYSTHKSYGQRDSAVAHQLACRSSGGWAHKGACTPSQAKPSTHQVTGPGWAAKPAASERRCKPGANTRANCPAVSWPGPLTLLVLELNCVWPVLE